MKNLNKSIVGILVLSIVVNLFLLYSNKKATSTKSYQQITSEQATDSILSETHKIDKKINNDDITWVGIDVKRNDKNGTRNYELWRFDKNKKPLLIDNFWLSTAYSAIKWNPNGKGGLNVRVTISGGDAATMTDFVYDHEGMEQLRIVRESNKDYYFTFQQKNRAEVEVSSLIEGICKGEALYSSSGYMLPEVTLKGVQLTRIAAKSTTEDFLFAEPTKAECEQYDGSLINPSMEILHFDDESIEFSFSDNQKGKIILKPFPEYAEVSFQ